MEETHLHPTPHASSPRPRTLIVDDNVALADVWAIALDDAGYLVTVTHTGADALVAARREPFDVAVLDYQLPDMTGVDALKALRAANPGIHATIATAHSSDLTAADAYAAGAGDYLVKPVPLDVLVSTVGRLHGARRAGTPEAMRERAASTMAPLDPTVSPTGSEQAGTQPPLGPTMALAVERRHLREEKARVEDALRERERMLGTLMANLPGMAYRCRNDAGWTMEFVSEGCAALTGYQPSQLCGPGATPYSRLIHPDDLAAVRREVQRAVTTHTPFQCTYRIRTASGEEKWVWEQGRAVFDSAGEPLAIEGFITDMTERVRGQQALDHSERQWQATFDSISDAIAVIDRSGTILRANRAMQALLGRGASEVLGRRCYELMHGTGSPIKACPLVRMCRSRSRETEVVFRDGRWLQVVVDPVLDERGNVVASVHLASDVTEQKRTQDSLARLAALVDSSQDAILSIDLDGTIVDWNSGAERLYGYRGEEIRARPITAILPPDRQDEMARNLERIRRGERIARYETLRVAKDGRHIPVAITVSPIYGVGGELVGVSSVGQDISESREAQARIHFQASLLDQVRNAVIATDLEGRITHWNRHAERLYGWRAEEVLGRPISEVTVPPTALDSAAEALAAVAASGYWEGEFEVQRKDGSVFPSYVVDAALKDEAGRIVGYVGVSTDLSERKHLEEELRQAQKMEAIGRLAGGVAHDFNNLLLPILSYSEMIVGRLTEDDPLRRYAEQVLRSAERAAALPRQLLAFSRKQVLQPKVLDLNALISETDKMLRRLIGEDIDLTFTPDPTLGQVRADPGQLEQVLLNLAVNARDAMPQGGRLTLETANVEVDPVYARPRPEMKPGRYVRLTVSDTGCGMDQATQARIWEPFYTTKEQGKGTGLGLSTVHEIVKQSGGEIEVESAPGQGATFRIYLPRIDEPTDATALDQAAPTPTGRGETLLLVEDDEGVRASVQEILEVYGYTVLPTACADEALAVSRRHAGPIHLLLTDVVMPGVSGRQLAERLMPLRPEMRLLYMSGYTDDALGPHGVLDSGVAFIQKPFTPGELARKLREVLGDARNARQ